MQSEQNCSNAVLPQFLTCSPWIFLKHGLSLACGNIGTREAAVVQAVVILVNRVLALMPTKNGTTVRVFRSQLVVC
jgi:hypothetical protein